MVVYERCESGWPHAWPFWVGVHVGHMKKGEEELDVHAIRILHFLPLRVSVIPERGGEELAESLFPQRCGDTRKTIPSACHVCVCTHEGECERLRARNDEDVDADKCPRHTAGAQSAAWSIYNMQLGPRLRPGIGHCNIIT